MLTQLQGTEHFETLSASQCHVVERLVQSSKLTVPELASVLEEVNTTGFAEVHRQHLLGVVGRKSVPASVVVTAADQKYQNWESFKSYLPQRVWSQLSNDEGPTALFTFLRDLGLRLPSEGTHQVASVILLVSTEGNEKALAMSACAKNEFLKASKRWWKAVSNNAPPPLEMIWNLPASPQELRTTYPATYERNYSVDPPIKSPLDSVHFEIIKGGNWMRYRPGEGRGRPQQAAVARGYGSQGGQITEMFMSVISHLAQVLGNRVLGGGRGIPGLRFAGEGMEAEGRQASLQDVTICDPRVHSSRAPAILDGAAPPLTSQTPSPCNVSQPLVLAAASQPLVTVETQVEQKPSTQPKPSVEEASVEVLKTVEPMPPTQTKLSVEEASAAVLKSLLNRDKARADKAAERAAAKAAAKKAAKEAAIVATKADAKKPGKVKPEGVTPKKRSATDVVKDSSMFRIDHERSIPQWLLRTGWKQPFGPGSKGFRYIKGDEASAAKKLNECKGFAKKLCLDRGLASPAL